MKSEHKELIHDYLHIDKQNKRIENRIYNAEVEFYAQNFYGGTDFYDPIGIRNKGFRVETRVSSYVDFIESCKRNIEKNKRKQHYFKHYTDTLDPHTYSSLKRRYGSINRLDDIQELGHDEQVLDEILEIEEAISYEYNTVLYVGENKDESLDVDYSERKRRLKETTTTIASLIGV